MSQTFGKSWLFGQSGKTQNHEDRNFALNLNEYLNQLEIIFNSYSMLEQGQGKIGVISFHKFMKNHQFNIDQKSIELMFKSKIKNSKIDFQ